MKHAADLSLKPLDLKATDLVLIAPNDPRAMAQTAAECTTLGIPYLYDPSMQAPRMTADELEAGFQGAKILTGNDYEFGMMAEKLGISEEKLRHKVPVTVVTKGASGALITAEGVEYEIPPAKPREVVDPTGAGDAYRAGLVKGLACGFPWEVCGRMGALASVYCIEHSGTQHHHYTLREFADRYAENFGRSGEVESLLEDLTTL
jgi:adenosine kinase